MKIIKTTSLYLITAILPSTALYLAFDGWSLKIAMLFLVLVWGVIYTYLDKILLMVLDAREVIDTDEQLLFQNIKNQAYRRHEILPKVYLYSGEAGNCFVLESRNEWTILLERNLLRSLNEEQCKSLVEVLYAYNKSGKALIQTKSMGIISFVYSVIYWCYKNLMILKPSSSIFKIFFVFTITLLRPILIFLEFNAKQRIEIPTEQCLKPIFLKAQHGNKFSYIEYIMGQIVESDQHSKDLLVKYIETFPVINNCVFNDEYEVNI